ncbi:hypothetical protein M413DRAFT_10592 [Hebeloma cylindrosporum]|uniref:Uncharacterized protein n=1 Tax=Hebeloma cylindrosporum TaxID=76867 RepID=A0A0C3CFU9_HEBCY|nr:hypothetical protein M413DRAFT_10592 [Hebeloma cylindrosporum h7]
MPGNGSKKSQESDWTFDFRTSSRFFDDSDSESAPDDEVTVADTASAKNRPGLLDGIDLSTREETVVYKPNPFSIAKINAANRAQNQKHRALTQGRQNILGSPQRRLPKVAAKPTQSNLLDGFNIQAQKEGLRMKPTAFAQKPPQGMKPSNAPLLAQAPASHLVPMVVSVSPTDSQCISSTVPLHREGHSILSLASVRHENAHILAKISPFANCRRKSKEDLHDQKNALSTVPVSPAPPRSAQFSSRFAQNFNSRASKTALPMSSPLRGSISSSDTNLKDASFSSPVAAGTRSDVPSPAFMPHRRTLFKPSLSSTQIEPQNSTVRPTADIPAGIAMAENLPPLECDPQVKAERGRIAPFIIFLRLTLFLAPSTPPREFLAPKVSIRKPIFQSQAPIISSFSRNYNRTSVPDAYAFGSSDPDEEWSTLPSRKRKKPNPEAFRMPLLTKPFKLPGLLPTDVLGKTEVKSRRKIHLYVPPPLLPDRKSEGPNSNFAKANGSSNPSPTSPSPLLNKAAKNKASTDADVYPSPSRSRVSKPSLPQILTRARPDVYLAPKVQASPIYHPPSPPTSDLPVPGEDTDVYFHIDPQDVRRKHPATKALFEKRTRDSYAYLRGILELDSCGVVFKDAGADLGMAEQNSGIAIPHWPSGVTIASHIP